MASTSIIPSSSASRCATLVSEGHDKHLLHQVTADSPAVLFTSSSTLRFSPTTAGD